MTTPIISEKFPGWEFYPSNLSADDTLGFDVLDYSKRLTERSGDLFSDDIEVRVIDVNYATDATELSLPIPHLLKDAISLEKILCQAPQPPTRIISINQEYSLSPFRISEELMRKTLTHYAVPPRFLDVLFGVSGNTKFSEEGYGAAVFSKSGDRNGSCDISYQFKFIEKNDHEDGPPWSIRQMEVFNRVQKTISSSEAPGNDFWLVLNPTQDSKAQNLIEKAFCSGQTPRITGKPMRLHLQLISAHVDNWRAYLDYEGQIYQEQRKLMLTTDFEDDNDFNASMNFDAMLTLRSLQDRLLSVPIILGGTILTIEALVKMNRDLLSKTIVDEIESDLVCGALSSLRARVNAHAASANMLQKRVQGVEDLLADGLSMRNQVIAATNQKVAADNQKIAAQSQKIAAQSQQTATEISKTLLDLTLESVDDSAYVKLVSLATLIYLPGSFVASLFGTNFFVFGPSEKLRLASNVWIYVVVTIPLTVVTIAFWWLASQRSHKQHRNSAKAQAKEAA